MPIRPENCGRRYASGTNHTLPTCAWAQFCSGVNIDSFIRKMTLQSITREGLSLLADSEGFVRILQEVIQQRHVRMPEGSYTTKLFIKGVKSISKKVGEEASETIIEAVDGNRDRFIYEISDLAYHALVLMEQMGVSIADIEAELKLRHS